VNDTYRHKGLRKKLVDGLVRKGIDHPGVLEAIGRVPRHFFMESGFIQFSYQDKSFPIGAGQTISQPFTVAFQTQLLDVKPRHKVLEVGTGSGYQTAVLAEMGARVFSVERHKELFIKASNMLSCMGYKPMLFHGDGYEGKPTYGPYDRIIVTAGAEEIPGKLISQLKKGGIMVIPVGDSKEQKMIRLEKKSEKDLIKSEHGTYVFVPLLKGVGEK